MKYHGNQTLNHLKLIHLTVCALPAMIEADKMAVPGILYVTMQPKPSLSAAQFHDWYNNEHGPNRLRLPFVENGFRYRATDLDGPGKGLPEWMAIYDITDMAELTKETYQRLRREGVQSQREKDTMKEIVVDRKLLDARESKAVESFRRLEEIGADAAGNVLVAVNVKVHPGKDKELDKWFVEEYVPMLSKVPGWRRTRRFVTSSIDPGKETEFLVLHEWSLKNGLGTEPHIAASNTTWAKEIKNTVYREVRRRVYQLYYTFGAAPRDLSPLSSPETNTSKFPDGLTKTIASPHTGAGAIESYVTTKDNIVIRFRLEGSPNPSAPCIILDNSILVDYHIWDGFIASFLSQPKNEKYRILRYQKRGRSSHCGTKPVTLDVLSEDQLSLMNALRIPKAAALIGVSLGGATVLNTALKHPDRVSAFIACDTSAKSPAGNEKAWMERIAISEAEGAISTSTSGEKESIVGEKLAEMTVRRWFVKESYDALEFAETLRGVKAMVETNSLEGFKKSVQALWEYDDLALMVEGKPRGAFLVGSGDGALPGVMKNMAASYAGGKGEYIVIEGAGHLPMLEKPKEVANAIGMFLNSQV